jgi:hypothetical protein
MGTILGTIRRWIARESTSPEVIERKVPRLMTTQRSSYQYLESLGVTAAFAWGSRGRRFKSCQPDRSLHTSEAGNSRRATGLDFCRRVMASSHELGVGLRACPWVQD